jgi:hydroxymethylpyrimidine pyrophosphatase-like HAD family hydrolase
MIIAIDFDGTLHSGKWPGIGGPLPDAISVMNRLKADGHYLIIWTCREGDRQTEMANWLVENGIPFDCINDHKPGTVELYGYASRKVYAHLYIDDKQVGGLPQWDKIYKYVCKIEAAYKLRKYDYAWDSEAQKEAVKQPGAVRLVNEFGFVRQSEIN